MTPSSEHDPALDPDPGPPSSIVRSEERLRVGTRTAVTGRVRVRKVVTSHEVTQTVTVRREELVVEELPVTGEPVEGTAAGGDRELELVLHEERLVVTTVPVERVRVRVERVGEDVTVSEVLRREQVGFDVVPSTPPGTAD